MSSRPYGSLSRPRSRFKRPLSSWFRRVLSAGKLRLGFTLVYLVVAGAAFAKLYWLMRDCGYFYSVAERHALWRQFPDQAATATLETIYGDKSPLPEMRIIRRLHLPFAPDPDFARLLKDPGYSEQAEIARSANFDARMKDLETVTYYYRFEELLALSDNGRLLSKEQRQRLDKERRQNLDWFINEAQPENEARVQAFRFRLWGYYSRPWPLDGDWSRKLRAKARENQRQLVAALSQNTNLTKDIEVMRRLQLQIRLAGLDPKAAAELLDVASSTRDWYGAKLSNEQLTLLAHYKKALPKLDLSALTAPQQRAISDCLRELTANP